MISTLIVGGGGAFLFVMLVNGEKAYSLNDACNPDGWYSVLEETLLPKRWWRNQLAASNEAIKRLEGIPDDLAKMATIKREAQHQAGQLVNEFKRTNPGVIPPTDPATLVANGLRERADLVEAAQALRELEKERQARLHHLMRCRAILIHRNS